MKVNKMLNTNNVHLFRYQALRAVTKALHTEKEFNKKPKALIITKWNYEDKLQVKEDLNKKEKRHEVLVIKQAKKLKGKFSEYDKNKSENVIIIRNKEFKRSNRKIPNQINYEQINCKISPSNRSFVEDRIQPRSISVAKSPQKIYQITEFKPKPYKIDALVNIPISNNSDQRIYKEQFFRPHSRNTLLRTQYYSSKTAEVNNIGKEEYKFLNKNNVLKTKFGCGHKSICSKKLLLENIMNGRNTKKKIVTLTLDFSLGLIRKLSDNSNCCTFIKKNIIESKKHVLKSMQLNSNHKRFFSKPKKLFVIDQSFQINKIPLNNN